MSMVNASSTNKRTIKPENWLPDYVPDIQVPVIVDYLPCCVSVGRSKTAALPAIDRANKHMTRQFDVTAANWVCVTDIPHPHAQKAIAVAAARRAAISNCLVISSSGRQAINDHPVAKRCMSQGSALITLPRRCRPSMERAFWFLLWFVL